MDDPTPRLFVDCDSTLLLYKDEQTGPAHHYGFWKGDPCSVNEELVGLTRLFRHKWEDALIVIWSGGGSNYAHEVMRHVGLGEADPCFIDAIPMIKDQTTFYLVRENDYVVDDEQLAVPCKVWAPDAISQLAKEIFR